MVSNSTEFIAATEARDSLLNSRLQVFRHTSTLSAMIGRRHQINLQNLERMEKEETVLT